MEVWPNWAARWTQLQPSPSIKDGSAPYFMSCTTIDRWPCLGDERTKRIRRKSMPRFRTLKNTHFNSAALIFFFSPPNLYYTNKLAARNSSRRALRHPELAASCARTHKCLEAEVAGDFTGHWRWARRRRSQSRKTPALPVNQSVQMPFVKTINNWVWEHLIQLWLPGKGGMWISRKWMLKKRRKQNPSEQLMLLLLLK